MDLDEFKREKWVSLGHEWAGFASKVTVMVSFVMRTRIKRSLDLKDLEEAVEGGF